MSKHTPGPWLTQESTEHWGRVNVTIVSADNNIEVVTAWQGNSEKNRANARRIVACVNWLAQFTTEQIEDFGYDLTGISSLQNKLWLAQHQRDELLAEIRETIYEAAYEWAQYVEVDTAPRKLEEHMLNALEAAIAKVTGEAA